MERTSMLPQGHMIVSQFMMTSMTLKYSSISLLASCRPCAICRLSPLGYNIKYAHCRPDPCPQSAPLSRPCSKIPMSCAELVRVHKHRICLTWSAVRRSPRRTLCRNGYEWPTMHLTRNNSCVAAGSGEPAHMWSRACHTPLAWPVGGASPTP